jgi:TonB family protein
MNCRIVALAVLAACAAMSAADEQPLVAVRDVAVPRLVQFKAPRYPSIAVRARIQGDISVEVTVGEDGRPTDVRVSMAIPLLLEDVVKAVKGWRYEPTLVDGTPRSVHVSEPLPFRIGETDMARGYAEMALEPAYPAALRVSAIARLQQTFPKKHKLIRRTLETLSTDSNEVVARTAASALASVRTEAR